MTIVWIIRRNAENIARMPNDRLELGCVPPCLFGHIFNRSTSLWGSAASLITRATGSSWPACARQTGKGDAIWALALPQETQSQAISRSIPTSSMFCAEICMFIASYTTLAAFNTMMLHHSLVECITSLSFMLRLKVFQPPMEVPITYRHK